jgi:HEAT repeat protein
MQQCLISAPPAPEPLARRSGRPAFAAAALLVLAHAGWGLAPGPACAAEARAASVRRTENLEELRQMLQHEDLSHAWSAIGELRRLGPAAAELIPELLAVEHWEQGCFGPNTGDGYRVLETIGPVAVPALVLALDDPRPYVRSRAATGLGEFRDEARSAQKALMRVATSDPEPWVRLDAVRGLGRIGPDPAAVVPLLADLLRHGPDERLAALEALGEIGPAAAAAVPTMIEALADEDVLVRRGSAEALRGLGTAALPALPALVQAARDPDEWTRSLALAALGSAGEASPEALDVLLAVFETPDGLERYPAIFALEELGSPDERVLRVLQGVLRQGRSEERAPAARALRRLGADADSVVPLLIESLAKADADAALELGEWGAAAEAAVPLLEAWIDGPSDGKALRAAAALAKIQPASAGPRLRLLADALDDAALQHLALRLMQRLGPDGASSALPLARLLESEHAWVRFEAARTLGSMGPAAAVALPALLEAMRDWHGDVRRAARDAALAMGGAGPAAGFGRP